MHMKEKRPLSWPKKQGITPPHHVRGGHDQGHSSSSSGSMAPVTTALKNYDLGRNRNPISPKQAKFQAYRRALYRRLQERKRAEKEAVLMGEKSKKTPTPMDVTTTTSAKPAPNHDNTTATSAQSAAKHDNNTATSAQTAANYDHNFTTTGTTLSTTMRRRYSSASTHGDMTQGMISGRDLHDGSGSGSGAPLEEKRILTAEEADYVRRSDARRRAYLRTKERAAAAKMGIIIPPGPRGGAAGAARRMPRRTPGAAVAAGTALVEPPRAPEKVLTESTIEEIFADRQFGVRIEKIYDGVKYRGTIRNIEIDQDGEKRYLVVYDDENTCEHMTLEDVRLYRMFLPTSHDELDETGNQLLYGNSNASQIPNHSYHSHEPRPRCRSRDHGVAEGGLDESEVEGDAHHPQSSSSCMRSVHRSVSRSVGTPQEESEQHLEQQQLVSSFHGEEAQTMALSTPRSSGSKDNTLMTVPPGGGILTDMDVDPCNFF